MYQSDRIYFLDYIYIDIGGEDEKSISAAIECQAFEVMFLSVFSFVIFRKWSFKWNCYLFRKIVNYLMANNPQFYKTWMDLK